MSTITKTTAYTEIECGSCFVWFCLSDTFIEQRRKDHETWYCPNGCKRHYPGKSPEEQLRDQLAREKHWREQAEERVREQRQEKERITRRLNATRGVVTRHKRKIAAGKCPCCSAAFKDLASHMKNRHPNWDPVKEAEVRA